MATLTRPASRRQSVKEAREVRQSLNMRIRPETRSLLDLAADLTGKNLTDFVLDAARQAAQSALLDRSIIPLKGKTYKDFVALLEAPPQPDRRLRRSLQTPAPWE